MSAQPQAVVAPNNFNGATRRKIMPLGTITRPTGGGQVSYFALPRTGYLGRLFLAVRGSITGTLTAPNPLGYASIINRLRLTLNSGLDLFNVSGGGYHYLLRQSFDTPGIDPVFQSNARSAVAAGSYNLDMIIPIAMNMRDAMGLLLLQSESTLIQLSIEWLADAAIATGITTHNCTVTLYGEVFTVPNSPNDQPPANLVHQIIEEQSAIASATTYPYVWPRGGIYLQLFHGFGMGVAGADNFSRFQVRAAQSDFIQDTDVPFLDMEKYFTTGLSRLAGTIPLDLYSTTGLGMYDLMRDTVDTSRLTDMASVVTTTGAGTLYSLRRQLIVI